MVSEMVGEEQKLAERVAARMYEHDAAAKMLGITLDEIRPGYARMKMTIRPEMLNGHGIVHGGMTFSLADTAFAYACNSQNHKTVALACHITYVIPGRAGDVLTAVAEEQIATKKTGVYDINVTNQDGAVVAFFRGNSYRTRDSVVEP